MRLKDALRWMVPFPRKRRMCFSRGYFAFAFFCIAELNAPRVRAATYTLGPDDQLQISVFDMRQGSQAFQWTAFNGPFRVDASGNLALPLVGVVPVLGKTTSDLAEIITVKLQARVGLTMKPDASVQILKYRPFYILGIVDKPGAYEFRPDLTVIQAITVAGGMSQPSSTAMLGFERDALLSEGDLRLLQTQRLALLARQARLDAEIAGAKSITQPSEIQEQLASNKDLSRLVKQEQELFNAKAFALKSQTETLQATKGFLQNQLDSLKDKDDNLAKQLIIIKQELNQISGLVTKGLAVLPRQLEIERNQAQFETGRIDVQLAVLRTQQDLATTERSILELNNTSRNQALQQATEVRSQLSEMEDKIRTTQTLIAEAEIRAPMSLQNAADTLLKPNYTVTRLVGGTEVTQPAQETDLVEPNDVIRVEPIKSLKSPLHLSTTNDNTATVARSVN